MGKGTPIMNFLENKVMPKYEGVQYKLGDKNFLLRLLDNCYSVLTCSDIIGYVGFMKEIVLTAALLNLHYTTGEYNGNVLGCPECSKTLAKKYFAKDMERIIKNPGVVYQFLSDVRVAHAPIKTLTMSNRNDYQYPALIYDIWLMTEIDPDWFCPEWYHDHKLIHPNADEDSALVFSWIRARTLFGKHGTYNNFLTNFIKQTEFYEKRINTTKEILEDKELYKMAIENSPE
jgi:hypothetical protein